MLWWFSKFLNGLLLSYLIFSFLLAPMKLTTNSKTYSSNPLQTLWFWPWKYLHSCIQWGVDNWRKSTKWQIGKLQGWWQYVTCLHLFFFYTIYTFIHHSFIHKQSSYLHSCRLSGRNLHGVPSRDSNSGYLTASQCTTNWATLHPKRGKLVQKLCLLFRANPVYS